MTFVPVQSESRTGSSGWASFRGVRASGVVEHADLTLEPGRLDDGGFWAVVGDFEGRIRGWRFEQVEWAAQSASSTSNPDGLDSPAQPDEWRGPAAHSWTGSLDQEAYIAGVDAIRDAVREGDVYQVNLCRVLSAPLPASSAPDARGLAARLAAGNPAPYAGAVQVEGTADIPPAWVVSASPELFLRVGDGLVASGPIKGTATTPAGLTGKDEAENIMIADMVRNDLQRICEPGTVEVTDLLAIEQHPGLVHLVTTVQGRLRTEPPDWSAIFGATYPPASVSGAPKHAALSLIGELEPVPRGPYCGAFGWIDADAGRAELAVGIRTFWWTDDDGGTLRFGTGAGITWGSDAQDEWAETELKAARLVRLASAD